MTMEQLKAVEIEKLSKEEIMEHKENVLALNDEKQIVEYLKYAIDNQYKTEEEGDNSETIDLFFKSQEFEPYYSIILNATENEE